MSSAILGVQHLGQELRMSTLAWFNEHAERLSLQTSLTTVVRAYRDA
jgi:hypothetical protein